MDLLGLGLIGGGASLLGGLLGGSSASKQAKADRQAAAEQRAAEEQNAVLENYYRLVNLLGSEDAATQALMPMLSTEQRDRYFGRAATAGGITDQDRARLQQLQQEEAQLGRGGPVRQGYFGRAPGQRNAQSNRLAEIRAEINSINARSQGDPGVTGMIRRTGQTPAGGGLLAEYQALTGLSDQRTQGLLGQFDTDTNRLLGGFDAMRAEADKYGAGQEDRIRRDAGDQEKRLNQNALARLAASGLTGSTLATSALTGNSRAVNRDAQDQILDLNDRRVDRRLGIDASQQGALSQRLAGRAGILGTGEDRFFQLARQPIDLKSSVLLNPRMPQITPLSSASSGAAFGSVLANALGGIGGNLGGLALQQYLSQSNQNNQFGARGSNSPLPGQAF